MIKIDKPTLRRVQISILFILGVLFFSGLSAQSITITNPTGGEVYNVGEIIIIEWTSSGIGSQVSIEMESTTSPFIVVIADPTANDGVYVYTIPSMLNGEYRLKMYETGSGAGVTFSNPFRICNLNISVDPYPASCQGANDGYMDVFINSGGSPFDWNVNPPPSGGPANGTSGGSFFTINGLEQGNYDLEIIDGDDCMIMEMVSIPGASSLNLNIVEFSPTCVSGEDGFAEVSVAGGVAPFDWEIIPAPASGASTGMSGSSNFSIIGLYAGNYTLTVSDANGCTVQGIFTISDPASLMIQTTPTSPTCAGDSDGKIDYTVSNGIASYSWVISPPPSSGSSTGNSSSPNFTIINLEADTYSTTITDSNGCTEVSVQNVVGQQVVLVNYGGIDPTCHDGLDGEFLVTVTNGTAPFQWNWSSGGNSGSGANGMNPFSITGLSSGNYNFTLTDNNGCDNIVNGVTLNNPMPLTATIISNNGSCAGEANGSYTISSVANGMSPYSYSDGGTSGGPSNLPIDVLNKSAGVYTVTITDANSCTVVTAVTVDESPMISLEIGGSTSFCSGSSTTLSAQEPGGNVPGDWTFQWSNNSTMQAISVSAAGTYNVTVTNGDGCTAMESVTVTENPGLNIVISPSIGLELCGTETQVLSAPNNPNYSYLWSTNETGSTIIAGAGTYDVTVTDNSVMCTGEASITIIANERPTAVLSAPTNDYCIGDNGPDITVTLTGQAPFDFVYTIDGANPINVNNLNASTYIIAGASQGVFEVISLTDANCPSLLDPVSNSIEIIENPLPNVIINPSSPSFCTDGFVNVSIVGTFDFVIWKKGSTTIGTGNSVILDIEGSDYVVEVQDANGCLNTLAFDVTEEENVIFEIIAMPGNVICPGESVVLDAGTFSSYQWGAPGNQTSQTIDVSEAGVYFVTVTDVSGCTGSNAVEVFEEMAPSLSFPITDEEVEYCEGNNMPTITFDLFGFAPFTALYSFNGGAELTAPVTGNQVIFVNAVPGEYTLTNITDSNCSTPPSYESPKITVTENETADFDILSSSGNQICEGENTILTATDNEAGYFYLWTLPDGATLNTAEIEVNQPGVYTLEIITSAGCSSTNMFELILADFLSISTSVSNTDICSGQDVQITIFNATSVEWLNPEIPEVDKFSPSITVSPLLTTVYMASVTNAEGCTTIFEIPINVVSLLTPVITSDKEQYCSGSPVILTLQNPSYSEYEWSNGFDQDSITFPAESQNTSFQVTVTDVNGCEGTAELEIDVIASPEGLISTVAPPVQTAFEIEFSAIDVTFDPLCNGIDEYIWTFLDASGNPFVTLPSESSTIEYTFAVVDTVISQLSLQIVDDCGCVSDVVSEPYSVIPNGSCGASIQFPEGNCLGTISEFTAMPDVGNPAPNKFFQKAYFIIDEFEITKDLEGQTLSGVNGDFKVVSVIDVFDADANDVIEIEFLDEVDYQIRYFVDFFACKRLTPVSTLAVSSEPTLSIEYPEKACDDETIIIGFDIDESLYSWTLSYQLENDPDTLTKLFTPSSSKIIVLPAELSQNKGIINLNLFQLLDNNSACRANLGEIEIEVLPPLTFEADTLVCDLENGNFELIYQLSGGSGDLSILSGPASSSLDLPAQQFNSGVILEGNSSSSIVSDDGCIDDYMITITSDTLCTCIDLAPTYGDEIYEACSVDDVVLALQESYFSTGANPVIYYETFDLVAGQEIKIDSFVIVDVEDQNQVTIEYNDAYVNDRIYFARFFIGQYEPGTSNLDLDYRCLTFSSNLVRFKFFINPAPAISGNVEVCEQSKDMFYGLPPQKQFHIYDWSITGASSTLISVNEVGVNQRVLNFGEAGSVSLGVEETYFASDDLTCIGNDEIVVTVEGGPAPPKSNILLFPGDFLISEAPADQFCYNWYSVSKNTGLINQQGPVTKQWNVGVVDTVNFIYICETNLKTNEICDDNEGCRTLNFFNSSGVIVATTQYAEAFEIFPNPANHELSVRGIQRNIEDCTIQLFNVLGEKQLVHQDTSQDVITLDVSHCNSGIYFVVIFDESQQNKTVRKVIIE